MDLEPCDTHQRRLSHSDISQYSDGSTSTVVPSPALTNEQHFKDLDQSPRPFLSPWQSPNNTYRSPSSPGTPNWDRSGRYQRWKDPSWKSHVDDGDEELQPLKPAFQDHLLHSKQRSTTGIQRPHRRGPLTCNAAKAVYKSRHDFLPIGLLVCSIYSTVMSALWLGLSVKRQRWVRFYTTDEGIASPRADLVFALIAKSIEITFVTVFIAYLGQYLSHRAHLPKSSRGVSLAEMSMRTWITQPGSIVTNLANLWHTAKSSLGVVSLVAALLAMLYTTASNTLVAPSLMLSEKEPRVLSGLVTTSFANSNLIKDRCQTPLHNGDSASTCINIEHSEQARFNNYMQYLTQWSNTSHSYPLDFAKRPKPVGTLYINTTVIGTWIKAQGLTPSIDKRVIHNVSMAFPHAGVLAAAHNPINGIQQPSDINRLGEYHLSASVPSPSVNIICSNVTEDELNPLVYSKYPDAKGKELNAGTWWNISLPQEPNLMNNSDLDDVFEFGWKHGRSRPIFPKYPVAYDTVLARNTSATDSIYLLAASPDYTYMVCSMRAFLSSKCSTKYDASSGGANLTSDCEIEPDALSHEKSSPQASSDFMLPQWRDVASDWALALGIGSGINDNKGAFANQLTQFIPSNHTLNPLLPSVPEALGVLAGCTLLLSSLDAPFDHQWNHNSPTLPAPVLRQFNATVQALKYQSGGTKPWQNVMYPVLGLTFLINCGCLFHFVRRFFAGDGVLITDFTEPRNVFALAMNSPPSQSLAGACGAGPEKHQFLTRWNIKHDTRHDHYYLSSGPDEAEEEDKGEAEGEADVEERWDNLGIKQSSAKARPIVTVSPEM